MKLLQLLEHMNEVRSEPTLWHGTTEEWFSKMQTEGVPAKSFWTPDEDIAWYFAQMAQEAGGRGQMVVAQLPLAAFDPSGFDVDNAMLQEPVDGVAEHHGFDNLPSSEWDNEIYELWSRTGQTWQDSLEVLRSVRYLKQLPPFASLLQEAHNPDIKVKKKGQIYNAYLKGRKVGQAQVYDYQDDKVGDDERYIWKAKVHPDYQRRGVASAIYDVITKDLESQGLKLVPSPNNQLTQDGYRFWKSRDPESIRGHGHFKAEPYQKHVGAELNIKGRPVVVTKVGWISRKDMPIFFYRYTDVPEGSVNSTSSVVLRFIKDQLSESVEEKFGKSVVWDNGQFFIAVNNPDKPTFFTAWTQDNEKVATLSTKVMNKRGEPWLAVEYVEVDPNYQRQGIARALYHVMIDGMSPEYAGLFGYGPDIASQHVSKIYQRYGAYEQEDGHFYIPNPNRTMSEDEKISLPDLETGDELMVGKFKNRKATIKGFKKDKNNHPIAKTDKGDQQIFKGRLKKLMDRITEGQMISSYEAAELIAQDDELFDTVSAYTSYPDVFDEHPDELAKFVNILRMIKPEPQRLYRGEREFEFNNYQPSPEYIERGFTSWSLSKEVANKWFNEKGNIVKYTDGPVQAVSIMDIADARMRSHPGESHYGGGQSEVLVLEPVERKVT